MPHPAVAIAPLGPPLVLVTVAWSSSWAGRLSSRWSGRAAPGRACCFFEAETVMKPHSEPPAARQAARLLLAAEAGRRYGSVEPAGPSRSSAGRLSPASPGPSSRSASDCAPSPQIRSEVLMVRCPRRRRADQPLISQVLRVVAGSGTARQRRQHRHLRGHRQRPSRLHHSRLSSPRPISASSYG